MKNKLMLVQNSSVMACFRILDSRHRKRLVYVIFLQIMLAILDLIGIALIGLIGALGVTGIQSQVPGNILNSILSTLNLSGLNLVYQTMVLGLIATTILIMKTVLTVFFTRRTLRFLSRQGALLSTSLIGKLLMRPVSLLQSKSIQSRIYATTTGVTSIALGVIASTIGLVTEGILLIVLIIGMAIIDPLLSLFTTIVFSLLGVAIYKQMSGKAKRLGGENSALDIESHEKISEVIMTYREAVVRNRISYYVKNIKQNRLQMADGLAELQFLPNVSKYILEIAIIVIGLSLSAIQFAIYDASRAIAMLAVFLAAGTRIAPALMRIQQNAIQIRISLGMAKPTLELIEQFSGDSELDYKESTLDRNFKNFKPSVIAKGIYFAHKDANKETLSDISFELFEGEALAIVGPSGSGKSTLIDLLLGILEPLSGDIVISGCPPKALPALWPGGIGYVPQNVSIISASIKDNISLGFPVTHEDEKHIDRCIRSAQLSDFVNQLPEGLHTQVGDRGVRLSGGEKQRLGIARALFTNPKLLVLDEATSSLDGKTESLISDAIYQLKGYVTLVIVAHRLSTIRSVDKVLYLDSGKAIAFGTLDWVRSQVKSFDLQAKRMGL